jgi:CBASS immunity sensor of nucleotide second messenger signals
VLTAPIGGQTVTVPFDHMVEATAPRYPTSRHPECVELTSLVGGKALIAAGRDAIQEATKRFLAPNGEGTRTRHVSVFALAPIPLLVFLGRELSNKVPSDLYQRHRDTEAWAWKSGGRQVRYAVRRLREGAARARVALVLSLSGTIRIRDLPKEIRGATVYEITLAGHVPRPTFLRTREDLEGFRTAYQEALGLIVRNHGLLRTIELFPAVPAPIAVLCGRELLPKVHPALRVWDYDKSKGGFTFKLEVN